MPRGKYQNLQHRELLEALEAVVMLSIMAAFSYLLLSCPYWY